MSLIPVVDIFAGPGGLGEGFSAATSRKGEDVFRIALSIEKDAYAHRTLFLRSFVRQFEHIPSDYYKYLRGECNSLEELIEKFPAECEAAKLATWHATLGEMTANDVDARINKALGPKRCRGQWVLIGGPPCQAYSLVGRARMLAHRGKEFYADERHTLYREYLRLISVHAPTMFIMENVKGLLSSTTEIGGGRIFEQILSDLRKPPGSDLRYRLFSLSRYDCVDTEDCLAQEPKRPEGFVIQAERHGIPQRRHRVIICGILENEYPHGAPNALIETQRQITCANVISQLPRLRSGVSGNEDTGELWEEILRGTKKESWYLLARTNGQKDVASKISQIIRTLRIPRKNRGGRFIPYGVKIDCHRNWYLDSRIGGVCNHETRSHMVADLHRYLYVASYGQVRGVSPRLEDFPIALLPNHLNVKKGIEDGLFNDRFRAQIANKPATTVTSHLAKDGHYFIHPDPSQCRCLTVREAARLQTFPDNYFFEGPRTEQYKQVGNAVPPLLARAIALSIFNFLDGNKAR